MNSLNFDWWLEPQGIYVTCFAYLDKVFSTILDIVLTQLALRLSYAHTFGSYVC